MGSPSYTVWLIYYCIWYIVQTLKPLRRFSHDDQNADVISLMNQSVLTKIKQKISKEKGWTSGFNFWFFCALIRLFRSSLSIFIFNYSIPRIVFYIKNLFFARNRIRENDLQNFCITNDLYFAPYIYRKNLSVSSKSVWVWETFGSK